MDGCDGNRWVPLPTVSASESDRKETEKTVVGSDPLQVEYIGFRPNPVSVPAVCRWDPPVGFNDMGNFYRIVSALTVPYLLMLQTQC